MSSGIDDSTVAMYSSSTGSTGGRHSGCGCGRSSDDTDRDGGGDDGTGGGCLTAETAVAAGCAAAVPFSRSIVPVSPAAAVVSAVVSTAVSVAAAAAAAR